MAANHAKDTQTIPNNTRTPEDELIEVESDIDTVQREIEKVEEKIERKLLREGLTEKDIDYWRDEEKHLRGKEKQLRDEEKHLRDEEKHLRDEEKHLRDEEKHLRDEKKQLRDENTQLRDENAGRLATSSEHGVAHYGSPHAALVSKMDEWLIAVRATDRATPQLTPASLGNQEKARLVSQGNFIIVDELPPGPSVLSMDQALELENQVNEHRIVAFITPYLESIFSNSNGQSTTVVVNSEEYQWLKTGGDSAYSQKPDLFVCHKAIYREKGPFQTKDDTLQKMRRVNDKFGVLSDWRLRQFIGATLEAKMSISNKDLGEVMNYGLHICFHKDGPMITRLVLFDRQEFWLVECAKGFATKIQTCKWTQPGSRDLLKAFPLHDPLMVLLNKCCKDLCLTIGSDAFLGQGDFGVVFQVQNAENKKLALKIVKETGNSIVELEQEKILGEAAKQKCPDLVVGTEQDGFKVYDGFAVLLISEVGEHFTKLTPMAIVESLMELHSNGILHGDPRVENVVCIDGRPQWIDFRSARFLGGNFDLSKGAEMKALHQSLVRGFKIEIPQYY